MAGASWWAIYADQYAKFEPVTLFFMCLSHLAVLGLLLVEP